MAPERNNGEDGREIEVERGLVPTSYGYVHYRAAGSGPPIVMLHCALHNSEMYLPVMRFLSGEYRCLALDLPFHGMSDHPRQRMRVPDFAASVREVLLALGLREVVGIGHALGGNVCIDLASKDPHLFRALILQTFAFYPTRENSVERHALRQTVLPIDETGMPRLLSLKEVLDRASDPIHLQPRNPTQEWVDEENRAAILLGRDYLTGLTGATGYDKRPALQAISCPTLLLWGKDFQYAHHRDKVARLLKNHEMVLLPDAGFFPYLDQPDMYREAVTGFLKRLP